MPSCSIRGGICAYILSDSGLFICGGERIYAYMQAILSVAALYAIFRGEDMVYSPQKKTNNRRRGKRWNPGRQLLGEKRERKSIIFMWKNMSCPI